MNESTGIVPRILARLFGQHAARLSERLGHVHWLSYLLVLSQSVAVVLVLGHAELPLLFDASWAIRALAGMGVFVLVATVVAADLALLETLRRIPVLARNRQRAALREHLAYVGFVLIVEASTYAVVLAALDSDPRALVTAAPLIPASGPVFIAQVVLRAILACWTAVQLVIVRGKLPVLLSTLTTTGKEIVGGHVERQLGALDIAGVALPDTFRLYAAMARPPRRVRTMWNGWLVRRELAAEEEEERQTRNVVDALEELERRRVANGAVHITEIPTTPERPPTGPGAPAAMRRARAAEPSGTVVEFSGRTATRSATPRHATRARLSKRARLRETRIAKVVAWLRAEPDLSGYAISRRLHCSESYARDLKRDAEATLADMQAAQAMAQ